MTPMLCTCGAHRYLVEDLQPGQAIPCFRCHDIFQRVKDTLVIRYRPPDVIYDMWREERARESQTVAPDDPKVEPDHPFLANVMCGRPRDCEYCGEPRSAHTTEYDISHVHELSPFTDFPVRSIPKEES